MKILIISTSSRVGGAAIACRRLLFALTKIGENVSLLIRNNESGKNIISTTQSSFKRYINLYRFVYERFLFFLVEKSKTVRFLFSLANTGEKICNRNEVIQANILHLHWINQGFISIREIGRLLKLNKPVIWTLHDMWAFTGGCHHSGSCLGFRDNCGNCPFLKYPYKHDLSYSILKKKKKHLAEGSLTIVTCSNWLANKAKESSLFKNITVVAIPNPIDSSIFIPINKSEARASFSLLESKKYLLFGAVNVNNYYKGFTYFRDALKALVVNWPEIVNEVEIVVLGRSSEEILKEVPLKCTVISGIDDEYKMCKLYNAVDWYITSSLQENLPNTIMESFSCGIPVVAFNVGGIPEMVDHCQNGYLAEYKSVEDLANGIRWALQEADYKVLSKNAREKVVSNYTEEIVAIQYKNLYNSLLLK